jgi:hypothetical protein
MKVLILCNQNLTFSVLLIILFHWYAFFGFDKWEIFTFLVMDVLILHINLIYYSICYSCVYGIKALYFYVLFARPLSATSRMA